jgi:hypothetical protein
MFFRKNLFLMAVLLSAFIFVACSSSKKSGSDDDKTIVPDDEITDIDDFELETDEDIDDEHSDDFIEHPDEEGDDDVIIPDIFGVYGTVFTDKAQEGKKVELFLCGDDNPLEETITDSAGRYEIEFAFEKGEPYCLGSVDLMSCFVYEGADPQKAGINPLTHLVFTGIEGDDSGCSNLRESETSVRKYFKLGTGYWLGELDYDQLTGINGPFDTLIGVEKKDLSEILEIISIDIKKEGEKDYETFFSGFQALTENDFAILDDANNEISAFLIGGSETVAPGFEIKWNYKNQIYESSNIILESEAAGEYIATAMLFEKGKDSVLALSSVTVNFFTEINSGSFSIADTSVGFSEIISEGVMVIVAPGTTAVAGTNTVEDIDYRVLSSGNSSSLLKMVFEPAGTVFSGDPLFFIVDLETVFSGDPIMLGINRVDSGGEFTVMNTASGDPIMMTASGDPIMFTASGDPIMSFASGDPIMMGNMLNTIVSTTTHFSDFSLGRRPVRIEIPQLLQNWTTDFSIEKSPFAYIGQALEISKVPGKQKIKETMTNPLEAIKVESELERLFNIEIGNNLNYHILENYFFINSLTEKYKERKLQLAGNRKYSPIINGFDIRSTVYDMFIKTTGLERSLTIADLFDGSIAPAKLTGKEMKNFPEIRTLAITALLDIDEEDFNKYYIPQKRDVLALMNFIQSMKGPSFGILNAPVTENTLLCTWLTTNSITECISSSPDFSIDSSGNVLIDGVKVETDQIEDVFDEKLTSLPETMNDSRKMELYRTLFLVVKFSAKLSGIEPSLKTLADNMKLSVAEMFEGFDKLSEKIGITHTVSDITNTVAMVFGRTVIEAQSFGDLKNILSKILITAPLEMDDSTIIEKVVVAVDIHSATLSVAGKDSRPVYKGGPRTATKVFAKTNIKVEDFQTKPSQHKFMVLGDLFEDVNFEEIIDTFANFKVIVIIGEGADRKVVSKDFGALITNTAELDDEAFLKSEKPGEMIIYINGQTGSLENAGMILTPGNKTALFSNNEFEPVVLKNLKSGQYIVEGFADGHYPDRRQIFVAPGKTEFVYLNLFETVNETEKGKLSITFEKKGEFGYSVDFETGEIVSVVITDKSNKEVYKKSDHTGKDSIMINDFNYGAYTIKASSKETYSVMQNFVVKDINTPIYVTLPVKDVCGNEIVEAGEECDQGYETGGDPLTCADVVGSPTYPENYVFCLDTCTWDTSSCF